jgi:hypothetical protein
MKTRSATRASEGLPRKRPSYDLEAIPSSRPKKQSRRPPKKKFPLMELPAEVRLKLLRELLWQPEPLKKIGRRYWLTPVAHVEGTNYAFHPAILATCRKLNEEGCTVLYEENTVDVIFFSFAFDYNQYRIDWMGYETVLEGVSKSLSQRARKLRITVNVYSQRYVPADIVRSDLRYLVKILQENPQWCSLHIHLEREELDDEAIRHPAPAAPCRCDRRISAIRSRIKRADEERQPRYRPIKDILPFDPTHTRYSFSKQPIRQFRRPSVPG